MVSNFQQSQDEIAKYVKRFLSNRAAYHASAYKEAHVRQEFIDPMFAALGWDVHNAQGAAPDYREVTFEGSVGAPNSHCPCSPTLRSLQPNCTHWIIVRSEPFDLSQADPLARR